MNNRPQVRAIHKRADISPKKVGVVMDLIRGRSLEDAKRVLTFDRTKAAAILLKLLRSAEANATNNHKLDTSRLYISELYAGDSTVLRRPNYGARGRYSVKMTRKSNIYLGLSEA